MDQTHIDHPYDPHVEPAYNYAGRAEHEDNCTDEPRDYPFAPEKTSEPHYHEAREQDNAIVAEDHHDQFHINDRGGAYLGHNEEFDGGYENNGGENLAGYDDGADCGVYDNAATYDEEHGGYDDGGCDGDDDDGCDYEDCSAHYDY